MKYAIKSMFKYLDEDGKVKRDFGISSTIVVLNNYQQKTNSNAHRIILG